MACDACRIFLIDSLPAMKFISSIQISINRNKWIKYSPELAEYCIEFMTILSKEQYDDLYNKVLNCMKEHMPLNTNLQNNIITEDLYANILLNMDRILEAINHKYKSLKSHALAAIQDRTYLYGKDAVIESEIVWLSCISFFIGTYNEIHVANTTHLKN
jgi:hypothetical protein